MKQKERETETVQLVQEEPGAELKSLLNTPKELVLCGRRSFLAMRKDGRRTDSWRTGEGVQAVCTMTRDKCTIRIL
jgi:hypothetical protein